MVVTLWWWFHMVVTHWWWFHLEVDGRVGEVEEVALRLVLDVGQRRLPLGGHTVINKIDYLVLYYHGISTTCRSAVWSLAEASMISISSSVISALSERKTLSAP